MSEKNIKKIGIKQDTGEYIYADIGVDADKVEINESMNLAEKIIEIDNKINNIEVGNYELPIASEEVLGGVKIGNGLEISEGGILNCTSSGSTDNTIELSKVEYDALPEDKLTNNITYFIKDMEIPSGSDDGSAIYDGDGNVITSTYAKKSLYDDTTINVGRKADSTVGRYSTAEGRINTASGYTSHAEGVNNIASGDSAHAEGMGTKAIGLYSHVEGNGTIAHGNSQHVQGEYNVEDTDGKYAHIVGGGTYGERKNIHTLDWEGNAEFAGAVKASNILFTLSECEASTNDTDIAGASALAELNNSLNKIASTSVTNLHSYANTVWANNIEKRAGVAVLSLVTQINADISAGTAITLCNIPEGFRPSTTYEQICMTKQGALYQLTCTVGGVVQIIPGENIVAQSIIILREVYLVSV